MKKAKNMSKKLIAILLSAAMTATPMIQSMPVYAAQIESEAETFGVMPEADEAEKDALDDVSENDGAEEKADGEQTTKDTQVDDSVKDDAAFDAETKNDDSDDAKADDADAEEKTEEKTETKSAETVAESDPVYEEVPESETESVSESGSQEESESESEEMSLEENRASFTNVTVSDVIAGGWNESIYVEIPKVTDASAITEVSWTGTASDKLDEDGLKYLVRTTGGNGTRIDIPGLKAGTYDLSITVNGSGKLTKTGIEVYAYDRSGYAHFNYTDGVGAYKDDGTLKDNAIVVYVTDENKNDVELTVGNTTVKGIGNILNSVGKECGEPGHEGQCKMTPDGKVVYGKANGNKGIIQKLSEADIPLVVRFVGVVSDSGLGKPGTFSAASPSLIDGLTAYDSVDYGGSVGDNGHMARMKSGENITLEGIGYDATIDGWGFHFMCESANSQYGKSFEVRNLIFINTPEDAIGMEGVQSGGQITASVERCWIHNNEFYSPNITSPAESDKSEGDGSVDFKRGQYFTCSYNYFERCHKTNLVGSSDSSLQYNLTYHHNYWYLCKARGPLTRQANVHMYNNLVDMQTDYAQQTRANAYIFSEYNMFYASKNPQNVKGGGPIKSYHDSIASYDGATDATIVEDKTQYVSNNNKYSRFDIDSSLSYIPEGNYQLEEDFTTLRKTIASQTGVQDRNPKRPENVSASEYSVIDRHSTAVTQVIPPQTLTPGKQNKQGYAFEVGGSFDIEITYSGAAGVLVNEAGENLLSGNGNVIDLPAGKYMIQADKIQAGNSLNGTTATFKEFTIDSIEIKAHDPNAHYHKWVLDSEASKDATCTEDGKKVYKCTTETDDGTCTETKEEEIPALGHSNQLISSTATCTDAGVGTYKCTRCSATSEGAVPALGHLWGKWQVTKPATADTEGEEERVCTRNGCLQKQTNVIPAGGTGSGDDNSGGNVTVAGDYELYFTGGAPKGNTEFFTVVGKYNTDNPPITVNDESYKDGLKMESSTQVTFECNDDAVLYMVFFETGKKVKVDGKSYDVGNDHTVTVESLSAGKHTIQKDTTKTTLAYLSVTNKASDAAIYTIQLDYNYDDSPDAMEISVYEGMIYSSMAALVPASFTRRNHLLGGLYEDAECTKEIKFPYVVNGNAILYAEWLERDVEDSHSLIFNANGGSPVSTVTVSASQIYVINQRTTKDGYIFAGWYDTLEGGNLVSSVDGSKMTGNMTVYAHWNDIDAQTVSLELDCNKEFKANQNIEAKTTINGFTIHALSGGVGTAGNENPKYYMTATSSGSDGTVKLGTNGVLLTDVAEDSLLKSIEFTAKKEGTLVVKVELSGKGSAGSKYDIVLAKQTSGVLEEVGRKAITSIDPVKSVTLEFPFDEAGTYYVYPEGAKGVRYYSLKVTEPGYTILYQAGTGTAPAGLVSVVKAEGTTVDIPSACTPVPGYIFKGWSIDGKTVLTGATYTVKAADAKDGVITMTALYDAKTYMVKYDAGNGTLPAGAEDKSLPAGVIINLEHIGNCIPPSGYEFKGWKVGDRKVTDAYTVSGMDADENDIITLSAVYDKIGGGTEDQDPSGKKGIHIENLEPTYEYTGDKIIPDFDVVDYGTDGVRRLLAQGVDYTASYKNNKGDAEKETEATITIKGKGNYAAAKDSVATATFKIVPTSKNPVAATAPVDLKGAKLTEKIAPLPYDGTFQYPDFKLTLGDKTTQVEYKHMGNGVYLKNGKDPLDVKISVSNNKNKGNATILVTGAVGKNNKPTTVKIKFKITPVSLENATVAVVDKENIYYSPNGATPKVKVTVAVGEGTNAKTLELEKGRDYTVKYAKNKAAGEASVTVTGKGNYTKKASAAPYTIKPAKMSDFTVKAVTAYEGIKVGKIKATVADGKGNVLKPNQYTLEYYAVNTAADGAKTKGTPYEGDGLKSELESGAEICVIAVAKDGKNLVTAVEAEKKTADAFFTAKKDIAKAKFTLADTIKKGKPYTGNEVYLEAADIASAVYKNKGEEKSLTMNTDYEIVSYTNNVNKGTATAVVKGIGEFSGTKTIKFKIGQQTITNNIIIDKVNAVLNSLFH